MDRDMDAIRDIVLALKESKTVINSAEGVDEDTFKFNAMLLIEAGLVLGKTVPGGGREGSVIPSAAVLFRLTWDGYDFADSIKEDAVWEKAKKNILIPAGSWTFGILSEYLKQELKAKFGLDGRP